MGVRGWRRRQRRTAGGVDLLSDDLLVRVLELLPDTSDAVRTGVLSRRWRRLWTHVPSLRLISGDKLKFRGTKGAMRFLALVNKTLDQRGQADAAALNHLTISLKMDPAGQQDRQQLVPRSIEAAQKWIRYGSRIGVKSFIFDLTLPLSDYHRKYYREERQGTMNIVELACSPKLETMHLTLDGIEVHLPATAVFDSLADLSLESIVFPAGCSHLLHRLLSSACCPRLQRLQLRKLKVIELSELLIEASALLELSWENIEGDHDWVLELKTPSLRVLRMECGNSKTLRISAPRLEKLIFLDGKSGVADIITGKIPHLRHLISLTVRVNLLELHPFGVGLADILTKCRNIKNLRVHCSNSTAQSDLLCNHLDHWESHEMCLADIQEVEFTGLVGTNCERWFMQRVLTHATQLQKSTLSFDIRFRPDKKRNACEIIPGGSGTWTCHHDNSFTYEWKPDVNRRGSICLEDIYPCI